MIVQRGMAELIDRPNGAQQSQPVGVIEEVHDSPGELPGEGEAAGHDGAGQPGVMVSGHKPREAA